MKPLQRFLPGSTIGVMGGGQLGRMFAIAARRMGYRIHTFSPDEDTPTGQLADLEVAAAYQDEEAVRAFAQGVDLLTFEFENIPAQSVSWASQHCCVRPSGEVLHICQERLREKRFLAGAGLPIARFEEVSSAQELHSALEKVGAPAVLKTASFGYDGKGQRKVERTEGIADLWSAFEGHSERGTRNAERGTPSGERRTQHQAVLEQWVPFEKELSVIVARGIDGQMVSYPVCENSHARHILDVTMVPANVALSTGERARRLAETVAERLDLVGLLAVEMFLLSDDTILINELAPRPHNSGHFSFDACVTSQFEQQLRAVCGLALGSTELLQPAAMANLLGDLWEPGEPDWAAALAFPNVKLHLYGKAQPRPGRKMGHLVAFGRDPAEAARNVRQARAALHGT